MQVRQSVLSSIDQSVPALLVEILPDLVLVFASPDHFEKPGLTAWLASAFPEARRIGLSTAGEIASSGVHENSLVITAIRLEKSSFRIASTSLHGMTDSRGAGRRLGEQLQECPGLRAAILFSQGVNVNGSEVIDGAVSVLGRGTPLTGGLAADNGAFVRTWTLCDDQVSETLMLAVGFYGENVLFSHGSFGGWQSFGPARLAARAQRNVLYQLDTEPALEVYKRYLGDYAKDLPASGLLFPLALLADDHQESGLIRTLLGINESDGSLVLAGDVPEGSYLRFMYASTEALVDGAEAAAEAAAGMPRGDGPSLALLVSCIGRKLVMGDRVDEEVEAVGAVLGQGSVLAGFYSNGEISPFLATTECRLHNQTMTITCISER